MDIKSSFIPIRVIQKETEEFRTISTADEAWKMLLDDWPVDDGKCFFAALLICADVQRGERVPNEARSAFIDAAIEAGVRLLS